MLHDFAHGGHGDRREPPAASALGGCKPMMKVTATVWLSHHAHKKPGAPSIENQPQLGLLFL
jgi:hypothetical protein